MNMMIDRTRRLLALLLKIGLIVGVIVFILLTVLSNLGGNDDTLRESVEGYISDTTGYEAQIETLNMVNFFPTIIFDFENLSLREPGFGGEVARLRAFRFSMSFWDVATRSGRFQNFQIDDLDVQEGVWLPFSAHLEKLSLFEDVRTGQPYLRAQGRIRDQDFTIGMDVVRDDNVFYFPDERPFFMTLGQSELRGVFARDAEKILINDLEIDHADQAVMRGHIEWLFPPQAASAKGQVTFAEHSSSVDFQVLYKDTLAGPSYESVVKSANFIPADIRAGSRLDRFVRGLLALFTEASFDQFFAGILQEINVPDHSQTIDLRNVTVEIKAGEEYPIAFDVIEVLEQE